MAEDERSQTVQTIVTPGYVQCILIVGKKRTYSVNKDNCFKGQQRKEHNLQINRWMISNWANTKEKKCEDYRANRTEKLNINNSRNLNDHWTRFCLPNGF